MERVGGRYEKEEGHFSRGQRPQWAVVPKEEEEEEEDDDDDDDDDECLTFPVQYVWCVSVINMVVYIFYKLIILFQMSVSCVKNKDYPT